MSARFYVAESASYAVEHGGRDSKGVVGEHKGREKEEPTSKRQAVARDHPALPRKLA